MGIAHFLRIDDKTTCGGIISTGCTNHILDGQPAARHGNGYICGEDKKLYHIVGGQPGYLIHGVQAAGTVHSAGTHPCKCRFINSISNVTHFYEGEVLSVPEPVTNRMVSVVSQNASKPLTMAPGPYCPGEEDKPSHEPVDEEFRVLLYESEPSTYEPYIFVSPSEGMRELYHKLNPDIKKQPGSILIVVDSEKQDQQQIETL